jgi:hypothetical protein
MRARRKRNANHLVRRRHLQIQRSRNLRLQAGNILVADVSTILAQMGGDPVGPGFDRDPCCVYRIGMAAAARIAHGRDMIDIDAESELHCHNPSVLVPTFVSFLQHALVQTSEPKGH